MKKMFLALGLLALIPAANLHAQDASKPQLPTATPAVDKKAPKIVFESNKIDYGTIEHNADGDRVFKFTNKGKKPLLITAANGSCGCTIPTFSKDPILPGKSGEIKVHYATDRIGAFEKTVTVTSNAETPTVVLTIAGTVKPDPAPAAADTKAAN